MSNSPRFLFACACIAASLALAAADGRAQQPPPAVSAQGPDLIRFVYGATSSPAAGVRVTIDGRGRFHEAITGPDGVAQIALDGRRLRVTDPQSGLLLLATFTFDRGKDVMVPLPVRITGSATGFGASPRIRIGFGHPISAIDFQRRATMQSGSEVRAELYGMELPRIAEDWSDITADPDGRFTSPWVAVWDAPQLVIAGLEGTLLRAVPLPPDMAEARTLDIGEQRPQFSSRLEVLAEPTTPPHALEMRAKGLAALPDQREQTALNIVLLNALDIRLGLFVLGRGSLPLEQGVPTRLTVPPLASLEIAIHSITPGVDLARTVTVGAADVTSIRLAGGDILGEAERRAPLRGEVRAGRTGPPVAGARVVYSSHPHQFTATTDSNGMFTIPGAFADRPGALSVETPTGLAQPNHRATVHHILAATPLGAADAGDAPRVFAAPSPPQGVQAAQLVGDSVGNNYAFCQGFGGYTQDEQYEYGPLYFVFDTDLNYVDSPLLGQGVDPTGVTMVSVGFSKAGTYLVGAQYTPYITATTPVVVTQPGFQVITLQPTNLRLGNKIRNTYGRILVLMNKNGGATLGAEMFFPSWSPAASPFIATVIENPDNGNSVVVMQCYNYLQTGTNTLQGIPAFAFDHSDGTFEGELIESTNFIVLK
jgi:hypothetical protein